MGALLRGIKREQIRRGQVIVAPGSVKAATKFLAQIYVRNELFSCGAASDIATCPI